MKIFDYIVSSSKFNTSIKNTFFKEFIHDNREFVKLLKRGNLDRIAFSYNDEKESIDICISSLRGNILFFNREKNNVKVQKLESRGEFKEIISFSMDRKTFRKKYGNNIRFLKSKLDESTV